MTEKSECGKKNIWRQLLRIFQNQWKTATHISGSILLFFSSINMWKRPHKFLKNIMKLI